MRQQDIMREIADDMAQPAPPLSMSSKFDFGSHQSEEKQEKQEKQGDSSKK
jgi:hypothetical protein